MVKERLKRHAITAVALFLCHERIRQDLLQIGSMETDASRIPFKRGRIVRTVQSSRADSSGSHCSPQDVFDTGEHFRSVHRAWLVKPRMSLSDVPQSGAPRRRHHTFWGWRIGKSKSNLISAAWMHVGVCSRPSSEKVRRGEMSRLFYWRQNDTCWKSHSVWTNAGIQSRRSYKYRSGETV